jgi:NADH dehydrogenase [ubiquinone] 1 alpha subcomplex assembly factor 7
LPAPPASPEPLLPERLARAIALGGPIPVAQFMAAANAHYYGTRDPIGASGDFVTAPEISQMFGELIGLWLADLWDRAGRPDAAYVELGPGRGTLARDACRAMTGAGLNPAMHFVETSPALRVFQAKGVTGTAFHADVTTLPENDPLLIVANEFFDALPVYQLLKGADGWHERRVACQDTLFLPIAGKLVPESIVPEELRDAPPGSIIESCPAAVVIVRALARRIVAQGGAALIIDYGYGGPAIGETLQAVRGHAFANPFEAPGEQDLTAHVDFATLGAMAEMQGARVFGPVGQGDFLGVLGIAERAGALARAHPGRGADIAEAHRRLTHPTEMGSLFRVLAIVSPDWPQPAAFAGTLSGSD